jgi:hypothetical protein
VSAPDAKILPFHRKIRRPIETCWYCGDRPALADVMACGLCEVCVDPPR